MHDMNSKREMETAELLKLENIKKYFELKGGFTSRSKGIIKAVDMVNLQVKHGDIYGVAGESGCGKTTLGYIAGGLVPQTEGNIYWKGNILNGRNKNKVNTADIQFIFQDVSGSLNPKWMVKDIIEEPLEILGSIPSRLRKEKVKQLMQEVGLTLEYLDAYPHELAGGQRQRVVIARAISIMPKLVICDEPFSALDVSVQAQIINLLLKLKEKYDLTNLIISHDLALLEYLCNRIAIMYLGVVVEKAFPAGKLFENPIHPYTKGLIKSYLFADPHRQRIGNMEVLRGEVSNPVNLPTGCRFHPRCINREKQCSETEPILRQLEPGRQVACHLAEAFY
ncbi:MAG: Oligopeptide transport ATP-binding protein OppF [Syntrophomonadaceae bacterium]|nr:Oligopeptide transport ATP-binding protein OppF [Bacillota bacterium]